MTTPKTGAPEWAASQAAPNLTVNEQARRIEAGAGLFRVESLTATAPPGSCADGACYIPAATATGAWAGKEKYIAIAVGANASNGWYFIAPETGMQAWSKGASAEYQYSGSAWAVASALTDGDKGDVVVSGSGATWTIDTGVVTLSKIANAAASSKVLGSGASGSGASYVELTLGSGLSISGSTISATGSGGTITTTGSPASGNLAKFSGSTSITNGDLSGDVTTSGALATTIANDAVTYAKMQNVSATSRVLGRKTAGAGDPEELTLSDVLDLVGSAAQGDILYRGASSWARLGAGASGQVLASSGPSANPSWVTPTGGSVGASAYIKISEVVTSGSQTTVSLSSISGAYRDLIVVVSGRSTATGTSVGCVLNINGDSGANYDFQQIAAANGSSSFLALVGQTSAFIGDLPAASATANVAGSIRTTIFNYAGTTFQKDLLSNYGLKTSTAVSGVNTMQRSMWWRSTSAVTSIVISLNSGAFVDGTVVTLYGVG